MAIHRALPFSEGHASHSLEYADATARLAATLAAGDVGRIARQLSDGSFWVLAAAPGTWSKVDGGVASVTASAPLVSSGGSAPNLELADTAVTPGAYTNANITVDGKGRITAAANGSAGGVTSFNSRTGLVVPLPGDYAAGDVGAEPAGAIATHEGAADPHGQYQRESEKDAANGYAGLDASVKLALARLPVLDDATHGNRSGGALHAVASALAAGFMSAADKTRFDNTGSNVITYQPGGTNGNGTVTTWAQVHAIAVAATGPWTLYVDDSLAAAEVPAGAVTDFQMYVTIDIVYGQGGGHLLVKDTAVLKNVLNIRNGSIVIEAATMFGMEYDMPGSRANIREGGAIQNLLGVSTVAAIHVGLDFFVFASIESGALLNDETTGEPTVPIVEFTSTAAPFFVVAQLVNTRGGASAISANCIVGDASATLLNIHDAGDRLKAQSGFLGTVVSVPIARADYLQPAIGDTASRTASAYAGTSYFDTDLGKPIWWTGSAWVDATGTVV